MRYADRLCERFSGGVGGAGTAILYPGECDWMGQCMPAAQPGRELDRCQVDFWVLPEDSLDPNCLPDNVQINLLIVPETRFLSAKAARALVQRPAESVVFVNARPQFIPDADRNEERSLLGQLSACRICPLNLLGEYCRDLGLSAGIAQPGCNHLHIYRYFKNGAWDYMVFNESADKTFCGAVVFPDGWQTQLTLQPYDSAVFHDQALVETTVVADLEQGVEMDLSSDWRLDLNGEESMELERLVPISALKPRFSGWMCYEREVELGKAPVSALFEAEWLYETADLYVDDKLVATRLTPPYRFDLSGALHEGTNKLRVEVAAPPARDALNYDMGPFGPRRSVIEPTGMFGKIQLKLISE